MSQSCKQDTRPFWILCSAKTSKFEDFTRTALAGIDAPLPGVSYPQLLDQKS